MGFDNCSTHNCAAKKTVISSKTWGWLPKKCEYGYINSKKTKYICIERRGYKNQIDKCSDKKNFLGGPIDGVMNNGICSAGTVGHNNVGGDESESQVANVNPQIDVPD